MQTYSGRQTVELRVNGEAREVTILPSDVLLDVLREQLGLTGAKSGCRNGDCGACTVMVNGWPVKSCLMLAIEAVGSEITTVEGLDHTPVQQAFIDVQAFQCGYCTPGFLMALSALALQHPDADENTMEEWLQSNICRCTSFSEIRDAASRVLTTTRVPTKYS